MDNFTRKFISLCENPGNDINTTSELWLLEDKTSAQVAASFLLLILVVGLPWNLLVVGIILKKKLYTQPTIILLLNLVLTDIFLLILQLPFQVWVGFNGEYKYGGTDSIRCEVCQYGVLIILFPLTSLYTISYMSFDRFMFIYRPLKYDRIVTRFRILLLLVLTWISATLIAALPLMGYGNFVFNRRHHTCFFNHSVTDGYYIIVLVTALLPVVPIVVFNTGLLCIVQKNITAIYGVSRSTSATSKSTDEDEFYKVMKKQRHQKELHLVWVFGGLLFCNLVTWLPIIVHDILLITHQDNIPTRVSATIVVLFTSQTLAHPVVETLLIKEVREPCKRILFYCCTKLSSNDSTAAPTSKPRANRQTCCGYCGDDAESSQSTGCSGCGLIEVCSKAVMMNSDSHDTSKAEVGKSETKV